MPDDDGKKKKKKKKVSTIRFDLFTKAGKFIFKVLRNIGRIKNRMFIFSV